MSSVSSISAFSNKSGGPCEPPDDVLLLQDVTLAFADVPFGHLKLPLLESHDDFPAVETPSSVAALCAGATILVTTYEGWRSERPRRAGPSGTGYLHIR